MQNLPDFLTANIASFLWTALIVLLYMECGRLWVARFRLTALCEDPEGLGAEMAGATTLRACTTLAVLYLTWPVWGSGMMVVTHTVAFVRSVRIWVVARAR